MGKPTRAARASRPGSIEDVEGPRGVRAAGGAKLAIPLGAVAVVLVISLRKINDPDFWTLLALGRVMARFSTPWIAEPFVDPAHTIAAGPASLLEWLRAFVAPPPAWPFQLGLYGLYDAGGGALVSVAIALVAAAIAFLLLSSTGRKVTLWDAALVVAAMAAARFRLAPRPEILGLLFLVISLRLVRRWQEEPGWGTLGWLVLLLGGWRVVHVTWTFGAAFSLLLLATRPRLDYWRTLPRWQQGVAGACAMAGAGGAIHFGVTVLRGMARGGVYTSITEMLPTWNFDSVLWPYLTVAAVGTLLASERAEGRRGRVVVLAAALALGLLVVRNAAVALVVVAFLGLDGRDEGARGPRWMLARLAALAAAVWLVGVAAVDRDPAMGLGVEWDWVPRDAAAFVQERGLPREVFNYWDQGGYLDWAWDGRPPTFLDGRISGGGRVEDHDRVIYADGIEAVLERRAIGSVLLEPVGRNNAGLIPAVSWFLHHPDWRLVRASDALVFVRGELPAGMAALPASEAWALVERRVEVLLRQSQRPDHARFTVAIARMQRGDLDGARRAFLAGAASDPRVARDYADVAAALGLAPSAWAR